MSPKVSPEVSEDVSPIVVGKRLRLFEQVKALDDACLENLGVFLGHCHVGVGEHLAHSLDTDALCQGPCSEGVAPDVHCQIDVQLRHARYQFELVVALLVAHQIEIVVILAQYGYGFGKQHNGVRHPRFQAFVAYAVILSLHEHIGFLDLHEVGVCKPRITGEDEHIAHLLCHAVQLQGLHPVSLLLGEKLYPLRLATGSPHAVVGIGLQLLELGCLYDVGLQPLVVAVNRRLGRHALANEVIPQADVLRGQVAEEADKPELAQAFEHDEVLAARRFGHRPHVDALFEPVEEAARRALHLCLLHLLEKGKVVLAILGGDGRHLFVQTVVNAADLFVEPVGLGMVDNLPSAPLLLEDCDTGGEPDALAVVGHLYLHGARRDCRSLLAAVENYLDLRYSCHNLFYLRMIQWLLLLCGTRKSVYHTAREMYHRCTTHHLNAFRQRGVAAPESFGMI